MAEAVPVMAGHMTSRHVRLAGAALKKETSPLNLTKTWVLKAESRETELRHQPKSLEKRHPKIRLLFPFCFEFL